METTTREARLAALPKLSEINREIAVFQHADTRRAIWQLANTLIPYGLLWYLMYRSLAISYALTLGLAVLAAGFLVRVFIFFHDCGHNSFFPSTRLNRSVGFWLGILVFTPGEQWWHSHAIHHATSGNLDKRGVGDVTTLTLEEFYEKAWLEKLGYRFFRNPLVMFILGPIFMFLIMHRLPLPRYGKRQTRSVWLTNLGIVALAAGLIALVGWKAYLMIQLPVIWIAGTGGIWLFYIQHQFEDVYWERAENWNYVASALLGASYYKLPRVLEWFTGSIGYHHIHHLSPRIPNYFLAECQRRSPILQKWARVVTIPESLRTVTLKVYNESRYRMEGFPKVEHERADEPRRQKKAASANSS
jgi:omega-6 fatty acid desaturase (delta-12 desaturase)